MSAPQDRDVAEALAALQRLHQHGVLTLEEAREAARLISGNDALEFPPPATPPRAEGPGQPEGGLSPS